MTLDLVNFEQRAATAVSAFWRSRDEAKQKQIQDGRTDQGERASVTSGKNMDGFLALIDEIVKTNGLANAQILQQRALLTLPGFFRPTKQWDVLIIHKRELIAAIEMKSHVGPSFGNNFNNRAEEAIGTAHDFQTAFRDGAFGKQPKPFVGWLMLVEDAPASRSPVRDRSPHFDVFPEFRNASYLDRYEVLCHRLMQEQLYSVAAVMASPRPSIGMATYSSLSEMTSLKTFITRLAGHVAAEAARLG
jgi:hypothetical protein